jgi:acyl-CoA synthetase (NDP forming)
MTHITAEERTAQFDAIFNAKSIAVVGAPRGLKTGKLFLMALIEQGFPGPIYPVNPEADQIDGLKAYPSVSAIPYQVDLAIILVPHYRTLAAVRECAAKGVRGAVLFTAGYKETGAEEGKILEAQLADVTRDSGMRIFGPNCMGIYAPRTGLSFFPGISRDAGRVGFVSHSGSLANILAHMGPSRGLRFSKSISLGNECDVTAAEMLEYLADDSETGVIGAYLEDIKDGPGFLNIVREAARRKPVILWKVGLTEEGSRAAAAHTGALAGAAEIWRAVVKQAAAVSVVGLEAMSDSLMGFSMLPQTLGDRIAVLSGPGGMAVAAAEACGTEGLRLAQITPETAAALSEFIPPTGTSLANPIDVGLTPFLQMDLFAKAARCLAADPNVDAVVAIGGGMTREANEMYAESIIRCRDHCHKPFLVVNIPGFDSWFAKKFLDAGVPFFDSAERALAVYSQALTYYRRRDQGRSHAT